MMEYVRERICGGHVIEGHPSCDIRFTCMVSRIM